MDAVPEAFAVLDDVGEGLARRLALLGALEVLALEVAEPSRPR